MDWNDDERKPNPALKRSSPQYDTAVKKHTNIYKDILNELDSKKRNMYNDIEYKEYAYEPIYVYKDNNNQYKEIIKKNIEVQDPEKDPRFAYM